MFIKNLIPPEQGTHHRVCEDKRETSQREKKIQASPQDKTEKQNPSNVILLVLLMLICTC